MCTRHRVALLHWGSLIDRCVHPQVARLDGKRSEASSVTDRSSSDNDASADREMVMPHTLLFAQNVMAVGSKPICICAMGLGVEMRFHNF